VALVRRHVEVHGRIDAEEEREGAAIQDTKCTSTLWLQYPLRRRFVSQRGFIAERNLPLAVCWYTLLAEGVLKEEEKGEYGDHRGPKLTGPK